MEKTVSVNRKSKPVERAELEQLSKEVCVLKNLVFCNSPYIFFLLIISGPGQSGYPAECP